MFYSSPFEPFQPVIGYSVAGISTASIWVTGNVDAISPGARGWIELGGTLGLIGGLSFACVTMWKSLQEQRKEAHNAREAESAREERREERMAAERREFIAAKDALEAEIRTDWKNQNSKLVEVLERLESSSTSES